MTVGSFNSKRQDTYLPSFDVILRLHYFNDTLVLIGTNSGAAFFDLERRALSWMYHCKSDILSQQFMQSVII
ncbi:Os07g0108000 [Oryza sativa Japonica Group]|uniref:Os07g0108000 protein n=1 Tax=Oryza sativa subsp. japonica TaxID=39947 RepID=Q0D946_ORYSJ|nr:Os07g0108000 [Oryza sativa Japonica Group]|eukprot:NP_001058713.2 Os07g0108000 [Oryza sativa Japonica Group]